MRDDRDYYNRKLQRSGPQMKICFYCFLGIIALLILAAFTSCKTKYVPVVETHTEHHWHTDSVHQTDSVISHETTLIKEVDSATMAKYGVQLKNMERAWLIQNDKLQRELSKLQSVKTDTFIKTDSVPKIVIKEVEKKQSIKQRISTFFADAIIGVIIFILVFMVIRMIIGRLQR